MKEWAFVEKKRFSYRIFGKRFNQSQNRRTTTMLHLGIDQHARQITVSLRDEDGDILLARQVSTQPAKINAFFSNSPASDSRMANSSWPLWRSAASTIG